MTGRPILTAEAMRTAEKAAIDSGTSVETLMERAGAALAEAVLRFAGNRPVLVVCGPGNNGGDGYVAARHLQARGVPVRVAALSEPATDAARWARKGWDGPTGEFKGAEPAAVLVDCLFGTGLKRGLDESVAGQLRDLAGRSQIRVACDLPSGVDADSGALLSAIPDFDLTVAFGALKPAHRLMPAMAHMGRVVSADIGIDAVGDWHEIGVPTLPALAADAHKYSRGLVHALAGEMPGAIALAANAAARAGAGYVRVSTSRSIDNLPAAIVQTDTATLNDPRIGCVLVGPGMGDIPQVLTLALTSKAPIVIDADALGQIGEPERLRGQDAIVTPHEGEFVRLFGEIVGSKPERAAAAAKQSGAVVVYKGPDTLVAAPDGRLGFAPPAPAWLASAGTGDVLAGMIAGLRAQAMDGFEAACAAVWLHGRAAEIAGPAMIADELIEALPHALVLCR
ncbi:NAD(P)H-hydrate dehydratase [Sphingomonas alba]|uniref:Bifunctional NAD(P)H-hydrate repair enzyme n=1 Tax=Sphingomonas alba TaxID=2908208 RepID=A0ABT0RIS2_9SPHN|nr:NAD(P)H-hydrate dehydratase [Sphingomonas alba]MCL6682521.1 NAD(P)H-hydrate dehydratase [Sphingomonas alba]